MPVPVFGGRQPVLGRLFKDQPGFARPEIDPATGGTRAVAPGRARPMALPDLVDQGLARISGTVELRTDRKPELEEGTPVALSGRVTVEGTGEPVEGAEVILRSAFYTRALFYDHHLREVARAVTDVDGKFTIERLNVDPVHFGKGGKVYLSVRHDDYAPLPAIPLMNVTPGYRNRLLNLALPAESFAVKGIVVDQWEGKPVVGGRVLATGSIDPIQYPKDQREALFLSSPETVTDEAGRFTLTHVGRGPQWITIHGGNDCAGRQMVQVPAKGEVKILSRQLRGRIEGRVMDEYDRPIPLVKIDGGQNTTHSFADGSFVLENFRGDVVTVTFTHVDYRPHPIEGVHDGERELLVRMTSKWRNVLFRVVGHAKGRPIRKVSVKLEFAEGKAAPLPSSPFYLSKKGVHAVRVPDGVVKAVVEAKGREPAEVELTGARDGDEIEVVLRKLE
ncbi:MAG: carboxypeptidase-like regulatory domain-containing protein [Planctomycetota bacterium]